MEMLNERAALIPNSLFHGQLGIILIKESGIITIVYILDMNCTFELYHLRLESFIS